MQPALGHGFSAQDEVPGGAKVFLVSDALSHTVFGGDPRAVGKAYLLDGENYTLVGVMPLGFDFPKGCGIWVPTSTLGAWGFHDRISHPYHVLGRLRAGTNLSQAEVQIETIQERLAKAYPATDTDWHVRAQPLLNEVVGNVQTSLFVLLGAVGFILLIACTNVVNLMLARASARGKEFAIRAALGAGRHRLLRQNLAEAFILVFVSLVLALGFAKWGLELVVSLTSINLPRMESFHLNVSVLAPHVRDRCADDDSRGPSARAAVVEARPARRASRRPAHGRDRAARPAAPGRPGRLGSGPGSAFTLRCRFDAPELRAIDSCESGLRAGALLTMKIALPSGAYPKLDQTSAYLDRLLKRLR